MGILTRKTGGAARRLARWLFVLCALAFPLRPEAAGVDENQVKAAFLYKFGAYVEWPAEAFETPKSALTIAVIGDPELADELQRIATGRQIGGREVLVRMLPRDETLDRIHMLFVGSEERARLDEIVQMLDDTPALVVTESEQTLPQGSMINFVIADSRVRFDVALATAEQRQLKISSRLLAVARRVETGPR